MVRSADSLGRGFDEGNYPAAPLFKNSANYERLKEKYKDNIIIVNNKELLSIFRPILTVLPTITPLKQVMQKNHLLRRLC